MTATVTTSQHDHVTEICFSRPPHNFASPELIGKIADALDAVDADPEMRCSLLTAEGKSFCAGADLAGDADMTGTGGMDSIAQLYAQAQRVLRRKKPMIAAVQGAAIGAGLGLAMVADFRIASPAARFSANFVRLGFHPGFGLTHSLPRLLGAQRAAWMMLSAERVKAEAALDWGLIDRLVAAEQLPVEAHAMAREIAENAPLALLAVRETLMAGFADDMATAMRHEHVEQTTLKATEDYKEGVASVFERREAKFSRR
jgi:enoyl-CoA hydratase/carnithine racemase